MTTHSNPICKSHGQHAMQNLQLRLLSLPTLKLYTFILTILTVFVPTSGENKTPTKTEQSTTTANTIFNGENDSIYYPSKGQYGDNILLQGKHEYTAQQNSLNVVRSKGGNIKIIITSANINSSFDNYGVPYWRYIPETNRNWTIAEYHGKTDSQIFSSNFDGGDCDVALLFLDGTFKIDYFENESQVPAITKTITVKYNYFGKTEKDNKDTIPYVFYPDVHLRSEYGYFYDSNCVKQLLKTGLFSAETDSSNHSTEKWFGIFKNESEYYLKDTKVRILPVYEGNGCCVCDSSDSGFEVQITNTDTCITLIPEFDFLKNHKILQADLSHYIYKNLAFPDLHETFWQSGQYFNVREKSGYFHGNQIFPGDTIKIMYMGVDYKIYATGGKKGGFMNEWQGVFNYKLYLSSSKNGQLINQLLIAHPDIREMISILFAGDIDGDGFLDLLIKNNFWEHEEINTLFLSKPAYDGQLLKVVGKLINPAVGCC